ncbi:MAG: FecR domain-containing protein [Candidatus Symbiothrix sp.]|jgi:ferric-dicitrate binding protein FerR (iron transport regulator)|nr:FecR domain-containing protein [Candidatus Symbiothrix sp.]
MDEQYHENIISQALSIDKKIREIEACDTQEAFGQVLRTIRKHQKQTAFRHTLLRAAAILALPLLLTSAMFGYMAFLKPAGKPVYAEVTAAPGSVVNFELPDRSKVWLNSGSTLRYPATFKGDTREVTLRGEGYFEVLSDKKHPFYVATADGVKVMAYGTRFNVNTEDNTVQTILAEGKVSVFTAGRPLIELQPGDQAVYDESTDKLSVGRINLYEKLAWKDGKIVFRNAGLSEVFRQLSRRYNVDIVLHDQYHQSENYRARVAFSDETIQQIFTYLEVAAPIEWKLSRPVQYADSTLAKQRIDVWLNKKRMKK